MKLNFKWEQTNYTTPVFIDYFLDSITQFQLFKTTLVNVDFLLLLSSVSQQKYIIIFICNINMTLTMVWFISSHQRLKCIDQTGIMPGPRNYFDSSEFSTQPRSIQRGSTVHTVFISPIVFVFKQLTHMGVYLLYIILTYMAWVKQVNINFNNCLLG